MQLFEIFLLSSKVSSSAGLSVPNWGKRFSILMVRNVVVLSLNFSQICFIYDEIMSVVESHLILVTCAGGYLS
ncbi:hypothetical protein BDQ17DRAFT_1377506 [Cyathus striatus]|nr:hypothetical protein BDQ17DRAFT_1377506 [Cyathus striatus]